MRNGSATGPVTSWSDTANAYFGGTPGKVYVSNGSNNSSITAGTLYFTTSGYTLAPIQGNAILATINGNFVLGQNVGLSLTAGTATSTSQLKINGSMTGAAGSSFILPSNATSGQMNQVILGKANSDIAVPITITGAANTYASLLSTTTGTKISGDITNNSAAGLLLGADLNYDLTVAGKITGTGNVIFSGATTSGGAGARSPSPGSRTTPARQPLRMHRPARFALASATHCRPIPH
ncbi:MAG: hypothetical protein QM754_09630 [Tepidisphaeraceae bacterium]